MEQFWTAITISAFMMMGCTLYVLIWEAIDNRKKKSGIDLGDELHQKIVYHLNTDDKDKVTEFIEQTVIDYLKDK